MGGSIEVLRVRRLDGLFFFLFLEVYGDRIERAVFWSWAEDGLGLEKWKRGCWCVR